MPRQRTGSVYRAGKVWKARILMPDGKRKRVVFPEWFTEEQAKDSAAQMARAARDRGVVGMEEIDLPKTETCEQWWERYLDWRESKGQATVKDARGRVRKWVWPTIGPIDIRIVKPADLERVVRLLDEAVRVGDIEAKTADNVWGEVTSAFKHAYKSKVLTLRVRTDDPSRDVLGPDPGIEKSKPILYPSEVLALLACPKVPRERRWIYALAVYTAARSNELAALTAVDVDLLHRNITIAKQVDRLTKADKRTKTKRNRTIEIEAELTPLLSELMALRPSGRLLRMPPDETRASFLRADLRTAGVVRAALFVDDDPSRSRLTFHNLRDTGLTWMAVRGDDPLRVQWRGGHTDFKTTQRYIAEGRNAANGFGATFPPLPASLLVMASEKVSEGYESHTNHYQTWASPTGFEGEV